MRPLNSHIKIGRQILVMALPLICINVGIMLMQFVDAVFLSWYSPEAIAAVVPAGMASFLLISMFIGTAGYTATFVAHYFGSNRIDRAHSAVWQGIYCALAAGVFVCGIGFFARPLMALAGHAPLVLAYEVQFFEIMCWGSMPAILSSALGGYFIGQGRTKMLMVAQIAGFSATILLDWLLIFGPGPFPRLGVRGAAFATVAGQLISCCLLAIWYARQIPHGVRWSAIARFNRPVMQRLLKFGLPSGIRFAFEMLAWTLFLFIVGRLGTVELAASNIAFRINGLAFFPIIGIAQAVSILVGQSQGARDSRGSLHVTMVGMVLAETWMICAALLFVFFPRALLGLFTQGGSGVEADMVQELGIVLLRFIAIYCLLDAFNIVMVSALQAAGDTRWTMICSIVVHIALLSALFYADRFLKSVYVEWIMATVFVTSTAIIWFLRFANGKWRTMEVVESAGVFDADEAPAVSPA